MFRSLIIIKQNERLNYYFVCSVGDFCKVWELFASCVLSLELTILLHFGHEKYFWVTFDTNKARNFFFDMTNPTKLKSIQLNDKQSTLYPASRAMLANDSQILPGSADKEEKEKHIFWPCVIWLKYKNLLKTLFAFFCKQKELKRDLLCLMKPLVKSLNDSDTPLVVSCSSSSSVNEIYFLMFWFCTDFLFNYSAGIFFI